ncbi:MAG: hypothetical protein KDK56_09450 [Simkania sp.]|nr:hypothetical protein [Simkania sp.]
MSSSKFNKLRKGRPAYTDIVRVNNQNNIGIEDGSDLYPFYDKASSIEKADKKKNGYTYGYIVSYKGKTYNPTHLGFEPRDLDRTKSTVRIRRSGKIYVLWFYDSDLEE